MKNSKRIRIGVINLGTQGGNLGCAALGVSFLEVLNRIAIANNMVFDVIVFKRFPIKMFINNKLSIKKTTSDILSTLKYSNLHPIIVYYRDFKGLFFQEKSFRICDIIYDFTFGDSFTDIYGWNRFDETTKIKERIINENVPLILGSQTIGPFNDKNISIRAASVMKKCKKVYVRDEMSEKCVKSISGIEPIRTTDIAFFLPYQRKKLSNSNKKKIGINVSGLLWAGGYTGNNQFGLTIDYKRFTKILIKELIKKYEVHIIPHAVNGGDGNKDNDMVPTKELIEQFPDIKYSGVFKAPVEAKSYISAMDAFIGARMHATIAATSSGVPVIPVSYSRKFEGLYESLDYSYVIRAREIDTDTAVRETLNWIDNIDDMRKALVHTTAVINKMNELLLQEYTKDLINI